MIWAVLGGFVLAMFGLAWFSFVFAYEMRKSMEPEHIQALMPSGNRAWWRWVTRHKLAKEDRS